MLLVLACILPATLLAVILIYYDYQSAYADFVRNAMATARSNAMGVDQEFIALEATLIGFSSTNRLSRDNLKFLDTQARKLAVRQKIFNVVMEDASGQQLFNTFAPYGSPLPREDDSQSLRFLRTHDQTFISSVFSGPVTKKWMTAVGIPSKTIDGQWVALTATLTVERFSAILQQQHYPEYWITSIVDRGGRVVARSVDIERYIGTEINPQAMKLMLHKSEAAFETQAFDGTPMLAVMVRAANSGWTVAIGIPLNQLKVDMWRKLWSLVLATVVILGVGLLFAWKIGTEIRNSMRGLIEPALALGSDKPVRFVSNGVREADEVSEALVNAWDMLQHAQYQATHDVLTGIGNRAMFHAFLERELAAADRAHGTLSVLYLDLDNFKPINDTYGHAIGDKLLIEASRRLMSQLRKSDIAARLGGDEFAIVLSGGVDETACVVEKLSRLMSQPYLIEGNELFAEASIGTATYPQCGRSIDSLLAAADKAMYRAKTMRKKSRKL